MAQLDRFGLLIEVYRLLEPDGSPVFNKEQASKIVDDYLIEKVLGSNDSLTKFLSRICSHNII